MAVSPGKTPSYHPMGHHSAVISPPRARGVRADLHQPSTWVTKLKKLNSNDSCSSPNALPTAVSPRRSSPARPPQRTALPRPTHARRRCAPPTVLSRHGRTEHFAHSGRCPVRHRASPAVRPTPRAARDNAHPLPRLARVPVNIATSRSRERLPRRHLRGEFHRLSFVVLPVI